MSRYLSAAVSGRQPEEVIYFIIRQPDYQWIVSEEILSEYQEVLNRRKLKLTEEKRQEWLNLIQESTIKIKVSCEVDFFRDPKDAKFIACARSGDADFLITGDKDFDDVKCGTSSAPQSIEKTVIISVSLFKQMFVDGNEEEGLVRIGSYWSLD